MNPNPLISVVIPNFNCGKYITETIDTVLAQTYSPLEIIVVDDGSTDDSQNRLRSYGDKVRCLRQANQGVGAARNTGIRAARGEFIALLDADDAWHPQKLERQIWVHRNHPEVDVSGTGFTWSTNWKLDLATRFAGDPLVENVTVLDVLCNISFGSCSGALLRVDCFKQVGVFDPNLAICEDLDFWLRIVSQCRIVKIMENLTFLRSRPDSLSADTEALSASHRFVLHRAFRDLPPLKSQRHLRQMALASLHRHDAAIYFSEGQRGRAIRELLLSLWRWPLPLPRPHRNPNFVRPKMLARYCLPLRNRRHSPVSEPTR